MYSSSTLYHLSCVFTDLPSPRDSGTHGLVRVFILITSLKLDLLPTPLHKHTQPRRPGIFGNLVKSRLLPFPVTAAVRRLTISNKYPSSVAKKATSELSDHYGMRLLYVSPLIITLNPVLGLVNDRKHLDSIVISIYGVYSRLSS